MSHHVQDVTATGPQPARGRPALDGWDRAGMEARETLIHTAAAVHNDTIAPRPRRAGRVYRRRSEHMRGLQFSDREGDG
jgi:hypothetical protein